MGSVAFCGIGKPRGGGLHSPALQIVVHLPKADIRIRYFKEAS